jgi:DNA-binding MarR family transcriptional regulator
MSDLTPAPRVPDSQAETADYQFSEQVGHLLRRAYQRHVALFQQTIPDSQLTAAQFVVLCAVRDQGACSLSEVVRITAIDQATVRGVMERLKTRDLLVVAQDVSDRRKVMVITADTFGDLNPAERVAMIYLLRKMCDVENVSVHPGV